MEDTGRQWLLRVEVWLLKSAGMVRVDGVSQVFAKRQGNGIGLILAKVTDYFLVVGKSKDIKYFFKDLSAEFVVGKTALGGVFPFNGCEIDVGTEAIELLMWDYR